MGSCQSGRALGGDKVMRLGCVEPARGVFRRILLCVVTVAWLTIPALTSSTVNKADFVLVKKSERKLLLFREGRVLREFDISLGLSPEGPKLREGDFRTPEGLYYLDLRNPDSDFFLSVRISYPNRSDVQRAQSKGYAPGSFIMVHGLPNQPDRPVSFYESEDWTDGCIALGNDDMIEFWFLTENNTPIEILP